MNLDVISFIYIGISIIGILSWYLFCSLPFGEIVLGFFPDFIFIYLFLALSPFFYALFKPLSLGGIITFGKKQVDSQVFWTPSEGKVWTSGLNGLKEWNGSFYGDLGEIGMSVISLLFIGVKGFIGLKICTLKEIFFLGSALHVKIDWKKP